MANNITNVWKLMGIDPVTGTGTYKNRMGLGNAITRDNGIPLDLSTLHATYNDAVVYAATSSIAYVDQPIAAEGVLYLITEESQGKVKISSYRDSITGKLVTGEEKEYDVYLKRVGIVPTGDNASIVVNGEGLIKLFAFDDAQTGAVPVKEDGELVWKTLEEIGAGDGNDNTTYEFEVCEHGTGLVITPLFNGQPIMEGEGEEAKQVKYHLDLDVYSKGEVDTAIANAVDGLVDEDALADAIETVEAKIPTVPTNVGAFTNDAGYLVASDIEGKADKSTTYTKTEVDTAINTAVQGILGEGVEDAYNTLREIQDILEGTDGQAIDGLIEVTDANKQALEVLNGAATVEGSVAKQIADAVAPLATTSELQRVEGIADAAQTAEEVSSAISTALAGYTNTETLNDLLDGKVDDADLANYYTKEEIENKGYAVAATVAGTYATKEELAPVATAASNAETKANTLEGRLNELVAEGGEPNTINYVKLNDTVLDVNEQKEVNVVIKVNGTKVTTSEDKSINIAVPTAITGMDGYSALDARVTENTNDIAALEGQLGTTNTNVSGLTTRLAALEAEVGEVAESRIDALVGVTTQHTTDIGANTTAITTLNTETIPALQQAIVDGDKAINDKIGTVAEGKTVVDMINAVAGTIDFTPYAKKDEVAATYATIAALEAEAERADEAEKKIAGDLASEIARADAAEKANAAEIARVNSVLVAAIENEDDTALNSIKELAVWIEEHETEVLPVIEQQGKDIVAIGNRVTAVETAVSTTLPGTIAQALTDAKAYTDEKMVKADGTSIVNNEGTFSIGAVSTDKLVQGSMTLVLNGGNAQVTA